MSDRGCEVDTLKTFRRSRGRPHRQPVRSDSLTPDRCHSHPFSGLEPDTPWPWVSPRDPLFSRTSFDPACPSLRNAFFFQTTTTALQAAWGTSLASDKETLSLWTDLDDVNREGLWSLSGWSVEDHWGLISHVEAGSERKTRCQRNTHRTLRSCI